MYLLRPTGETGEDLIEFEPSGEGGLRGTPYREDQLIPTLFERQII